MKTALITGACINTGVAIVEKFASNGYDIIFTGRNPDKVLARQKEYQEKFPDEPVKVTYRITDSVAAEKVLNEK